MPTATTTVAIQTTSETGATSGCSSAARLLRSFQDASRWQLRMRPHITMVQRFVPAEDLDKVYCAIPTFLTQRQCHCHEPGGLQILLPSSAR